VYEKNKNKEEAEMMMIYVIVIVFFFIGMTSEKKKDIKIMVGPISMSKCRSYYSQLFQLIYVFSIQAIEYTYDFLS